MQESVELPAVPVSIYTQGAATQLKLTLKQCKCFLCSAVPRRTVQSAPSPHRRRGVLLDSESGVQSGHIGPQNQSRFARWQTTIIKNIFVFPSSPHKSLVLTKTSHSKAHRQLHFFSGKMKSVPRSRSIQNCSYGPPKAVCHRVPYDGLSQVGLGYGVRR